jgi:hypothetical protein
MKKADWGVKEIFDWLKKKARSVISCMFSPGLFVGNRDRVRKPEEKDGDDERLLELNKSWREMLRDDPWMKKLMTHVSLLCAAMGIFFLIFWLAGLYLPAKHAIFSYVCAGVAATIPYWLWVGKWHNKIEKKVFEAFKKRFGKHHHLK